MSDLVQRLRFVGLPLTDEAADEIERLGVVVFSMGDPSRLSKFEYRDGQYRTVTTTAWRDQPA